jgi:hypothetical protein
VGNCGLDLFDSEHEPFAGCSSSINAREDTEKLKNYQLLKKGLLYGVR